MELDDSAILPDLIPCIDFKEPARSPLPTAFAAGTGSRRKLVRLTGLEPVTLRLSSACSNQLSYRRNFGWWS